MAVDSARKEAGGQIMKMKGFSFILKTGEGGASERLSLSRVVAQSDTHLRKTVPATEWRVDGRIRDREQGDRLAGCHGH